MDFVKGHGTENDFVVLPDATGSLELTAARVRALCDRRRGLGADGVLRAVPAALVADVPDHAGWFMDYRNADGSIAEMCGNGVRVFARYLLEAGLVAERDFDVVTRDGHKHVHVHPGGDVTVDMGKVTLGEVSTATVAGRAVDGIVVDVGNPHLACVTDLPVETLDLSVPPGHDPAVFPYGVNVEFINVVADGQLAVRVHERGVGETQSCGTGTVAAVAAALHADARDTGEYMVDTPGGRLRVSLETGGVALTGPAVIVARGCLDEGWWAAPA